MHEKTLLFYDLETSGLSKSFAQVVEFAAIRTDMTLREIERTHFYVKLTRDVIPEPDAFATHRLSMQTLADGLAEPEAITTIHQLLNEPGTISLGYNTLGFDDEFLRFSFYRALLPPYTHQYSQGCGRMDLYPITVLYRLFQSDVMQWPQTEAGLPTMKLEHIAACNGWLTGQAHHAMTDVEATVSLARALAESSAMWEYVAGYFDKKVDWQRTQDLCALYDFQQGVQCPVGLLVMGQFGAQNNYVVPALCLGIHAHYRNQAIWLRLDKADLRSIEAPDDMQAYQRFTIRKKLGEAPFVLPLKPRYEASLPAGVADMMAANIAYLQQQTILPALRDSLLSQKYTEVEGVDIDACLYTSGFPSNETMHLCRDLVRQLARSGDASLLSAIHDVSVCARAQRYVWRHYAEALPSALEPEFVRLWGNLIAGVARLDFTGQAYVTPEQALLRCQALLAEPELALDQRAVLGEVHRYLRTHFAV